MKDNTMGNSKICISEHFILLSSEVMHSLGHICLFI
jgi:hypothetical protein